MFKELVKLEPLTDNDLMELASERAKNIVNQIKTVGKLNDIRVIAGSPGPVKKPSGKTITTDLSLEVIKPAAIKSGGLNIGPLKSRYLTS